MNNGNGNGHDKTYLIFVNGQPREIPEHRLTYLQVVQLAFPGEQPSEKVVFTVTFSNPHGSEGSLVDGDSLKIKEGVIINVKKTDQS